MHFGSALEVEAEVVVSQDMMMVRWRRLDIEARALVIKSLTQVAVVIGSMIKVSFFKRLRARTTCRKDPQNLTRQQCLAG